MFPRYPDTELSGREVVTADFGSFARADRSPDYGCRSGFDAKVSGGKEPLRLDSTRMLGGSAATSRSSASRSDGTAREDKGLQNPIGDFILLPMKENYIALQVSDGTEMSAYVAKGPSSPKAGVIVLQEAFGVNDYIRRVADRIAAEGYLVVAPELFHRTSPGFDRVEAPMDVVMPLMQALKVEEIENDVRAAHAWLGKQPGVRDAIGVVGFCMGGRASFIANSVLSFKAAVSLYGGGIADLLDRVPRLSAPMLFFWGGADPRIPRETWSKIPAAMDAAGKTHVDVEFSGAPHAYLTDNRSSYHKEAAELTWPLILSFFKQKLA